MKRFWLNFRCCRDMGQAPESHGWKRAPFIHRTKRRMRTAALLLAMTRLMHIQISHADTGPSGINVIPGSMDAPALTQSAFPSALRLSLAPSDNPPQYCMNPAVAAPNAPMHTQLATSTDPAITPSLGTAIAVGDAGAMPNQEGAQSGKPTDAPTDLWQRLRLGFGMRPSDNPRIETQVNWFSQHPNYLTQTVERSKRYLYHIVNEVQKRGMPTEIALLPMVESAYNPMAFSTSHASGIWQFVPATGKNFGLRQTSWYDGRRDVIAATNAALDYLNRLHDQFGTWELTLAAYNCGEGCVQHAIAKNQRLGLPTDYQSLSLPAETRNYVPKLLALKQIVTNPTDAGVSLDDIPDQAYFTAVTLDQSMDVSVAAKLANMPIKDFISLNPAYNKPVIRSDTPTQLLLPVDKADAFSSNLSHYSQPLVNWKTCAGQRGQSTTQVAKACHVTPHILQSYNRIALNRKGRLKADQALLVPVAGHIDDNAAVLVAYDRTAEAQTEAATPAAKHGQTHGKNSKHLHGHNKASKHSKKTASAHHPKATKHSA